MNKDWRYLAGLWDGEGCVCVARLPRKTMPCYFQLKLNITNTNLALLKSVQAEFGGRVWSGKQRSISHKVQHQWIVTNYSLCLEILQGMLPYLRYKDREARIAIEVLNGMVGRQYSGGRLPNAEWDRRSRLIRAMVGLEGRKKHYHPIPWR